MARKNLLGEQPVKQLILSSGRKIRPTAVAAGLDPQHVSRAVSGLSAPDDETRVRLPEFLGLTPEQCWTPDVLAEPFDYKRQRRATR